MALNGDVKTWDGSQWVQTAGTDIPDSALYHYPILERSTNTIAEQLANEDATANGVTNTSGTWSEGYAEDADGTDDYISGPSAWTNWVENSDAGWIAFTLDADSGAISGSSVFAWADSGQSPSELWGISEAPNTTDGLVYDVQASDGNRVRVETSNAVFDGSKHRFVIQRSGASSSDVEFWRDASQQTTNIVESNTCNFSFNGTPTPYFVAQNNNGADSYLNTNIDNIIFGERGTTLSSTEIQDDYDNQPWN
jgi:hypothetical protein